MPTETAPKRAATRTITSRSQLSQGGSKPYPVKGVALFEEEGQYGNQIHMEMDRLDEVWEDTGDPIRKFQWLDLQDRDGNPIWEGSDTDEVAVSFEDITGVDFFSDEAESVFVGGNFLVEDRDTGRKNKKDKAIYRTYFVENLGTDYQYDGKVRERPSANSNGASPSASSAPMSDSDVATYLAEQFNGHAIEDLKAGVALNMVKDDATLADVKTIFGKTLRGGLVRPQSVLIGLLIENGFATDNDGIFTAVDETGGFE